MDEICDLFVEKKQYRNKNELAPQHPFRLLVVGPSGGGKTNIIMNLVLEYLEFDKLYLFAKDLQEEKYITLIALFQSLEKKYQDENETDETLIEYYDDPTKVSIDSFNPNKQNLVIFDDQITESKENQQKINDLFVRGRKTPNCSIVYLTQSFFHTPPLLKKQCNYIILMNVNSQRELQEISKTYATDIDYKVFKSLYSECTKEQWGFMVLDMKTTNRCMKYRCKFDGLYSHCDESTDNLQNTQGNNN
jgi:GTPase SAR1 family protein